METIIIVVHVIVCIALVLTVLLQTGKGASLGAAFGGSTQTVFGATGGAGFFEKLTTAVAIIFMATSLSLTYMSAKRGGESIMKQPVAQEQKASAEARKTAAETAPTTAAPQPAATEAAQPAASSSATPATQTPAAPAASATSSAPSENEASRK